MSSSPTPPLMQGQFPNPMQQQQLQAQMQAQAQQQAQQSKEIPEQVALEKQRCTLLLEINRDLLQEAVRLRSAKEAAAAEGGSAQPSPQPDEGFVECLRRLQSNLAYLAGQADKVNKPGAVAPPYPAILTPPLSLPSIHEQYKKLNALFPGAKNAAAAVKMQGGKPMMPQNMAGSPPPGSV